MLDDSAPGQVVADELVAYGVEPAMAAAVATMFLSAAGWTDDDDDFQVHDYGPLLRQLGRELGPLVHAGIDAGLVAGGVVLAEETTRCACWNRDRDEVNDRVARWLSTHAGDVGGGLRELLSVDSSIADRVRGTGMARALLTSDLLRPGEFLDAAAVRATEKGTGRKNWSQPARERDPSLPDYWFSLDPDAAMAAFVQFVETAPVETRGALALGLYRCLLLRRPLSPAVADHVATMTRSLCRLWGEVRERDHALTWSCWAFRRLVPDVSVSEHDDLAKTALDELGKMRAHLRSGEPQRFADHRAYLREALFFALHAAPDSLWGVLRRLVLALRELPELSVPLDLRTWDEGDGPMPEPWGWVPTYIGEVLGQFLGRELARDDELLALRTELARFLLSRLKTKRPVRQGETIRDDDMLEPDPVWRLGYVHAVRELQVNAGKRGRNVLAFSMREDPDERVRAEAKRVHRSLRHARKLPDGISPRRTIYAALWWLRQTHVLSLGFEPDERGAQRTFRKEVRRVRELDRNA